jgi:PAS domain S-box-containing protein
MRVLVVEDGRSLCQTLAANLSEQGFDVRASANLKQALSVLSGNGKMDAVLLDLDLPDSSGLDTFFQVKKAVSDMPVVIVTAVADRNIVRRALQAGAQDYLVRGQTSRNEIARCLAYAVERHQAETRLRQSEKRTRLILENCTDAFVTCDPDGVVKGWNLQAEVMFGWKREEMIGRTLAETIIPERLREVHRQDLDRLASADRDRHMRRRAELVLLHRDGHEIPVELGLFPVHIGDDLHELCAFMHDISYRKQIESRTRHLNEELERRVEKRTAELARSNAELQQFAKIASHDLQEPLRAVEGYVRLLDKRYRGKLDGDADEFIDFILDGVERMVKLIQSVLRHASIGNADLQTMQFVDCNLVMTEVLEQLKPAIQESGARIEVGKLPVIQGNRSELLQLFQNLLSNALKYRGTDPPFIQVNAEENVHEWVFSVQDNGIGIDSRYTEKIFDMFARLHGKTQYTGTGIGLAICRKIVETHGGRIWVQSEPGKGSVFLFTLSHLKPGRERQGDN